VRWRRKTRQDAPDDPSADRTAEPSPVDELRPDVVVLDELSRVFAVEEALDHHVGDESAPQSAPDAVEGVTIRRVDGLDDLAAVDESAGVDQGASAAPDPDDVADADEDGSAGLDGAGDAEEPSAPSIIAIGGDDDLPDAVYLDEELGGDTASGPVFIDDDGSSDAIMPRDATSRGIEPRLRERRIGVRRAASRRRLWWALVAAVVGIVLIAGLAVLGSSWFAVDDVNVVGNVYTDPDELAAIVDDLRGTPVLRVDTGEYEARVEEIPWVESARVTTRFPDSATIEIRERTPVASMLGDDLRSRVLDADGRVLAVIDGQPVALVWISGPGTLDLIPGDFAPIGYSSAASLVTKLTPNIRSRVDSMLVTPDGSDLVLVLTSPTGPIEVRFGSAIGDNAQIEKLVRLERKLADIGDDPVSVIDVSTAEVTAR
jgi:cell division protein FtsQ